MFNYRCGSKQKGNTSTGVTIKLSIIPDVDLVAIGKIELRTGDRTRN